MLYWLQIELKIVTYNLLLINDFTDGFVQQKDHNLQYKLQFLSLYNIYKELIMWTKPVATEMRFGFEVTMYVMNK